MKHWFEINPPGTPLIKKQEIIPNTITVLYGSLEQFCIGQKNGHSDGVESFSWAPLGPDIIDNVYAAVVKMNMGVTHP